MARPTAPSPQLYAASASSQLPNMPELPQVVERGAGGGDRVAPPVVPEILAQAVILAGRRNELPHAGGVGARVGLGVVRALYHRQEGDLGGHPPPLDLLDDVVEEVAATIDHTPDIVGTGRVPLFPLLNERRLKVGHLETASYALPQV